MQAFEVAMNGNQRLVFQLELDLRPGLVNHTQRLALGRRSFDQHGMPSLFRCQFQAVYGRGAVLSGAGQFDPDFGSSELRIILLRVLTNVGDDGLQSRSIHSRSPVRRREVVRGFRRR